jgi:hypothetical protein
MTILIGVSIGLSCILGIGLLDRFLQDRDEKKFGGHLPPAQQDEHFELNELIYDLDASEHKQIIHHKTLQ